MLGLCRNRLSNAGCKPELATSDIGMPRKNGALGKKFDAYLKRQFVNESTNINSLADHHIWSTIKTLPATLPEPSFKDEVSSVGVTEAVCQSDLDTCQWVGVDIGCGCCALGPWFWDWRRRGDRVLFGFITVFEKL